MKKNDTAGNPWLSESTAVTGSTLDYALRYAAMGWQVFPCHGVVEGACSCGNPECRNPGKHPVGALVRNGLLSATDDEATIRSWFNGISAPNSNIAIRTGPESGFWVLDVDTGEGKAGGEALTSLEKANGKLPETAEAVTGGGGRHVLFSWPEGTRIGNSTSKLGANLDVRGEGGYIIVEPSSHASGNSYYWEGAYDPFDIPLADAPRWLLETLAGDSAGGAEPVLAQPDFSIDDARALELRQAMGYLDVDNYDVWFRVGMALKSSGAGAQAFGIWNEWSQSGEKYEQAVMRKKWNSFTDKADGIQIESIFSMAQSRGWVNPASKAAIEFEEKYGQTIEELNQARPLPEVITPQKEKITPFPVHGLNEFCAWAESTSHVYYPAVSQHAALCLAAGAASRLYTTSQGDPLSVYLGACARSIGEIRYAHSAIRRIIHDAGLRRMLRTGRLSTPQTVYRTLMRSPATIYLNDDYGTAAAFARRQPSGAQEQALNVIASLYGGTPIQLDSPEEAGLKQSAITDEQPIIWSPSLSMFALVGNSNLAGLLQKADQGMGALEQMLLVINDDDDAVSGPQGADDPPTYLAAHVARIRGVQVIGSHHDLGTIFAGNAELQPTMTVVPVPEGLVGAYQAITEVSKDRGVQTILWAARGMLRRIAAVLAVWDNPDSPVIGPAILDWSVAYVVARMRALVEQYEISQNDGGKQNVYDFVLNRVLQSKCEGLAKRDLVIGCKPFRNLSSEKRHELLEQMIADNMVYEVAKRGTGPARIKSKMVLVAAKYVKNKDV